MNNIPNELAHQIYFFAVFVSPSLTSNAMFYPSMFTLSVPKCLITSLLQIFNTIVA